MYAKQDVMVQHNARKQAAARARRSLQDFNAKSKRGDGMGDSKQVLI